MLVILAIPVVLLSILMGRSRQEWGIVSCRNHATFVGKALDAHVVTHGCLPHGADVPGEELFCRMDFHGNSQNCHAGAPGQRHGGWQMVNASPKSWDEILRTMKGKQIPVIWCGKAHRHRGRWEGPVRVVIAFGAFEPGPASLAELIKAETYTSADGVKSPNYYFMGSIVYGMPEEELKARLAEINAILRKNGEPETPLNIEGGKDYWKLAEPYQTTTPP